LSAMVGTVLGSPAGARSHDHRPGQALAGQNAHRSSGGPGSMSPRRAAFLVHRPSVRGHRVPAPLLHPSPVDPFLLQPTRSANGSVTRSENSADPSGVSRSRRAAVGSAPAPIDPGERAASAGP